MQEPLSRRRFLGTAGLGSLGLFWNHWLKADTTIARTGAAKARSVILIFNCGAPSHIDLWDPKPDAPDTIRGLYNPIATRVPGIQVSELLPRMAQRMDKLAVVRSVHHSHGGHNSGMHWSVVGRPYRMDSTLINPSPADIPSFGTLVGWLARRDGYTGAVPPYVITPEPHCDSFAYITPGQFGGCLGRANDPYVLNADPNTPGFRVPEISLADGVTAGRLNERRSLLGGMNGATSPIASTTFDGQQDRAFSLVTSPVVQRAFDLSLEPANVRERYGRHRWGQSHLLARRLVEAGSRFVTTVNGPSIVWDTHQNNFDRLSQTLVPPMERAYAALLDDLEERGLLETTLVIWMGDFGRTPIINADAGRDHWPRCYTMVLAGGGIRGGQVVGESDRQGGQPRTRPVTPADIHATAFAALGYNAQNIHYLSTEGRPYPVSDGEVIRELL